MNLVDKIKNRNNILSNLNKIDKIINSIKGKNILKKAFKILRKNIIENEKEDETIIQYFKDVLLSKLLQEFIQIDESCQYLHMEKIIIYEFNRFKKRNSIKNDERKYASYLATILDPTYEIIMPKVNLNSILLLFVQKTYKGKSKTGLFFTGNDKNLFREGKEDFMNQIEEYQTNDLSKINLIDGLNKLVDICKNTLFEKDKQIKPLLEGDNNQRKIVNLIFEKDNEIKLKDTVIKSMIFIIKNFYDSFDNFGFSKSLTEINILNIDESNQFNENYSMEKSEEKDDFDKNSFETEENKTMLNLCDQLEYDDLFFIQDSNWRENINEQNSKHRYLIYYLFKNPQIEVAIRNNLLETETFKNVEKTNKFPIYVHLLRIFSSKNELSFQGKTKTYTSNLIEQYLIDKIHNKSQKYFINNISWIGLLINNALTISNKFIPNKISYLYNYLSKLCEIQFKPSSEFEQKYKKIIEKLIDYILDSCFNNNIEEIFDLQITKLEEDIKSERGKRPSEKLIELSMDKGIVDLVGGLKFKRKKGKADKRIEKGKEEKEEEGEEIEIEEEEDEKKELQSKINIIHYLVHLNEIAENELEEKDKKGYLIFDKKFREISIDIEPSKNKLNDIYDNLISALKEEIRIEKEKRQNKEIEDKNKKIFDKCEELQNNVEKYIKKYELIKTELPREMFNKEVEELLTLQEKLRTNYGKEIFSSEKIKVLEIIIAKKYLIDEVRIIPKASDLDSIILTKDNLEKRRFYLPYIYFKSEMEVKKDEKKKDNLTLKEDQEIKGINKEKVEKIKLDIQNEKKDMKIKDIKDIEIKLLISDIQINKEIEKDKFLITIKEISKKIAKLMKKISNHLTEKSYIIEKMETIKDIIDELSKISLNDPKFIDGVTELINTKKICENFRELKEILIKKFEMIRENFLNYKKITEDFKNDKKGISSSYKLTNKIKTANKELDISTFKENNFNSPYIMLSSDNKIIQASYPIFNFKTCSIIPSLFGNTIYSVNIFSFVTKNLKAEIIKDEMINKDYLSLFFVPNLIPASNSIIISFIIPDKKIEKEEKVELNPCIKLSGAISGDINPLIIHTKFIMEYLPLKIIVYSDKFSFYWKNNRLIINKEFIKQGHSLKINFKILDFNGNYEFLENCYTLNSLENNSVDIPCVKLDKDEKTCAKFKIEVPITGNINEKLCHGLFSFYFTTNLVIPIEINSKIKKNYYELFYYDKYKGEIQNHNSNNSIDIYKYFQNKEMRYHLIFYIGYTDKEEHSLEIKTLAYNPLLSFEVGIMRGYK